MSPDPCHALLISLRVFKKVIKSYDHNLGKICPVRGIINFDKGRGHEETEGRVIIHSLTFSVEVNKFVIT